MSITEHPVVDLIFIISRFSVGDIDAACGLFLFKVLSNDVTFLVEMTFFTFECQDPLAEHPILGFFRHQLVTLRGRMRAIARLYTIFLLAE